MRISATDIDNGNNSLVYYEVEPKSPEDEGFFRIDNTSGYLYLNKSIKVSILRSFPIHSLCYCIIIYKSITDAFICVYNKYCEI